MGSNWRVALNNRQFHCFLEEVLSVYDDALCYSAMRRSVEAQHKVDFFFIREMD
jgi:hypothetical protein